MNINLEDFRKAFEPTYLDLKNELKQYQSNVAIDIETNGTFNSTYKELRMYTDKDTSGLNNICDIVKDFLEKINDNKINPIQVAENVLLMVLTNIMIYRNVLNKGKLRSGVWNVDIVSNTTAFFNAAIKSICLMRKLKCLSDEFLFIIALDDLKSDKIRVLYEQDGIAEEVCSDLSGLSTETLQQHLDTFLKNIRGD